MKYEVVSAPELPEGITRQEWATMNTQERTNYRQRLDRKLHPEKYKERDKINSEKYYLKSKHKCATKGCKRRICKKSVHCRKCYIKYQWKGFGR